MLSETYSIYYHIFMFFMSTPASTYSNYAFLLAFIGKVHWKNWKQEVH